MRCLLILFAGLLLAACYSSGKRGGDSAMALYDFGQPVAPVSVPSELGDLAVEVRAPLWLDSLGIEYRLAYAEPFRLREYTRARWVGPPAQLVQQRLIQKLGALPAGQGRTRCVLRMDLDEFNQVFDTPTMSRGVVEGRVQLLDRSRAVVVGYPFRIEKPAPSADARGGVAALTVAVDQLAADLLVRQKTVDGGAKAAVCKP